MERYKNLKGDSGIDSYKIGPDSITVYFSDGAVYRYTYQSTGKANVEQMKKLATAGEGLNGFINTVVKNDYSRKIW